MSLWRIAWSYLWNRKLTTIMTILSVGLAVALISTTLTLREETRKRFEEEGATFDLVVGAKGNPLQLVLSTVYFLDSPTGNVLLSDYEKLAAMEEVKAAFPIAMGDSYRGYRIVGTSGAYFQLESRSGEGIYRLSEGRHFEAPMEAVVGAAAAADANLRVGSTFQGTHGLIDFDGAHVHEDVYTVVGVLQPTGTPSDRAIFTPVDSVWHAHEHEHEHEHGTECNHDRELTAILLRLQTPALRFEIKERVNQTMNVMAAVPVNEIQKLYAQVLGIAKTVLLAIGYLVVVISSITILIGLYMAILQRRHDLAIMRALGASKGEIFGGVLIEAFWVTLLGLAAGWIMGTLVCMVLGAYLTQQIGFTLRAITFSKDLATSYSLVLLMGMVAGILPAWQAYHRDVAKDLSEL